MLQLFPVLRKIIDTPRPHPEKALGDHECSSCCCILCVSKMWNQDQISVQTDIVSNVAISIDFGRGNIWNGRPIIYILSAY
jgi:hypothetical protein